MLADAIELFLMELPPLGARASDKTARNSLMASDTEFTRLYRCQPGATSEWNMPDWIKEGQDASGHTEAKGRWFVADPSMLDWYREDIGENAVIVTLDVLTADLENYRVSNCTEQLGHRTVRSYSRDPENEFFLPREMADKAQPEMGEYERMLEETARRLEDFAPSDMDQDHGMER